MMLHFDSLPSLHEPVIRDADAAIYEFHDVIFIAFASFLYISLIYFLHAREPLRCRNR